MEYLNDVFFKHKIIPVSLRKLPITHFYEKKSFVYMMLRQIKFFFPIRHYMLTVGMLGIDFDPPKRNNICSMYN